MRLVVVRHGVTDWNVQGRLQGRTDVGLNVEGIRQSQRVASRLREIALDRVYSSPMRRATRTAMAIAAPQGLAVETDDALHEAHMGLWEGLTWEEVHTRYPELVAERDRTGPGYKGHRGESVLEVAARAEAFLNRLRREAAGLAVCVVTHASPGRQLLLKALGVQARPYEKTIRLRNATVSIVNLGPGGAILECLDDASHLA